MGDGLSDKLRIHISGKLAQNFDYTDQANRKKDINEFIETHNSQNPNNKIIYGNVKTSYKRILDTQLRNKGLDPKILGRKTKKNIYPQDMKARISPKPQAGNAENKPVTTKDGKPIIQTGQPVVLQPEVFDEKAVSASINGMWLVVKAGLPDLELLTEPEKDSLGALFKPMFNRYLANDKALMIVPFIAAAGIFLPKIVKARKTKKDRDGALTVQDTPKKGGDTPPNQPTTTATNGDTTITVNDTTNEKPPNYYSSHPQIVNTVKVDEKPKPKGKPAI